MVHSNTSSCAYNTGTDALRQLPLPANVLVHYHGCPPGLLDVLMYVQATPWSNYQLSTRLVWRWKKEDLVVLLTWCLLSQSTSTWRAGKGSLRSAGMSRSSTLSPVCTYTLEYTYAYTMCIHMYLRVQCVCECLRSTPFSQQVLELLQPTILLTVVGTDTTVIRVHVFNHRALILLHKQCYTTYV